MKDQLHVCLINDSFPPAIDGVANAVTNYAKVISSELGRATVVTPFYPDADDSVYDFPVIRYPSLDLTKQFGYRAGLPFSPEITARLDVAGFDLIHSHCPITSTMLARSVRARLDLPVILTYHTKFDIDIANAIRSKLFQEEAKALLVENISACDEVWTVSEGAGENLKQLGYRGDYRVMPNGVDFPQGRVSEALIEEVTAGFDLPEGMPVFLFVGRMMWYKGIRISLDALAKLAAEGLDFRMVFVGGGGDREEIMAYTQELGLGDRVIFVDPIRDRDRIRAWYCRADLFLFPSTFDTNGLVVREAAACGLGSVLVAGSCAAEGVTDGRNGVLIEENADSMATVLRALCSSPEAMKQIGDAARRELYLSWEDSIKAAYERYGVVIENYRAGRYPKHGSYRDEMLSGIGTLMGALGESENRVRGALNEGGSFVKETLSERENRMKAAVSETEARLKSVAAERETRLKNAAAEREEALRNGLKQLKDGQDRFFSGLEDYFDIFL